MKTIVIIENETVELQALVNLFEKWQEEINILTATEHRAAISIMAKQQVDLVVCDLTLPSSRSLDEFSLLTHTFPCIPCIALAKGPGNQQEELIKRGASHFLAKPVDSKQLLQHAAEMLDIGTSGIVRGIPIHSFLQMLESEEKTCTLQVNHDKDTGLLYIKNGSLIGAETKNFVGEEAAQLILSWQEPVVQLRYFNGQRKRQINKPLISIIMEAFALRQAREKRNGQAPMVDKHQLPLRHFSTMEKPIPLEIGSGLQLEYPHFDELLDATMVGMLQGNCIIITNPRPFADLHELRASHQRTLVQYIHKGRVWMFKTELLKTVESPAHLLFFEYPGVVHYHELRKAKRSSIFVPSTYHIDDQPPLYGALVDLSMTGGLCQIKCKEKTDSTRFDVGSVLTLHCLLPGIREEQKIDGRIRNMQSDETEIRLGIEFENLQPHVADTIGKYLFSIEGEE